MNNRNKRMARAVATIITTGLLSVSASATDVSAAMIPGGRLTGTVSQDKYIPANMTKIASSSSEQVVDETFETGSSTLSKSMNKSFNMDDIRTGSGSSYSSRGTAYYDANNGRGVSFVPLTGSDSVFGTITSVFGCDERFLTGATIYTSPRSANNVATLYKAFREEAEDGTPIVKAISNASDYFNKLAAYYHALQKTSGDSKTYSTTLGTDGKIKLLGDTNSLGNQAYNGYGPEFESNKVRGSSILNEGLLTAEGNMMVNGAKTFVGTSDNPYGDLFNAKNNILEDSYILIRRLLGVNNNDENGIPNSLAANDTSRNSVCTSSQNLSSWVSQANELTNYPSERQEWTIKNRVEPEVKRLEEEIKTLTEENERLAEQIAEIEKAMSDAINAAIKAYNEAMSSFSAAMSNYKGQGTPPSPPSPPNISGIASSFQSQITTINAKISENNQKIQEDYKLILEWKDPEGEKQLNAREEYNGLCSDKYAKYKVAVELFDGNGNLPDIQYGNGMRSGQSMSELGGETIPLPTDPNDIEGLLWYLWVSEGITEIPDKINSIEQLVGYDEAEKIKEFRVWLIQNEIYLNPGYSEGNGYTLNKDIWNAGELLKLWATVYGVPSVESVGKCLESENHAYYGSDAAVNDLKSISAGIIKDTENSGYNKLTDTKYPYLEGYTNASFIPKQSNVDDYSLFDSAMVFYQKIGMDSDSENIPLNKHINLGFYKDVEVTGYSNNVVQTSAILGRYEWYVYYDENENRENAEVVYHNTTTTIECPFTAVQSGTYWIDCYQSGYTTYEERLQYTVTYFLTEEVTHTLLMSSLTPDIQIKLDEKTVAEKIKLQTDENGYIVDESAMQWRAYGDRVVENFATQRVSDVGDIRLG